MNVFISWSGDSSCAVARALTAWLPRIIQTVKPYFTPADIQKGARWDAEIAKELKQSSVGILCITPESVSAPWMAFEAGALSKGDDKARVCPVLFGLKNSDLSGPLSCFQTTQFSKAEMYQLVQTVNARAAEPRVADQLVTEEFEKKWSGLESEVNEILANEVSAPTPSVPMLPREILELNRGMAWLHTQTFIRDPQEVTRVVEAAVPVVKSLPAESPIGTMLMNAYVADLMFGMMHLVERIVLDKNVRAQLNDRLKGGLIDYQRRNAPREALISALMSTGQPEKAR